MKRRTPNNKKELRETQADDLAGGPSTPTERNQESAP